MEGGGSSPPPKLSNFPQNNLQRFSSMKLIKTRLRSRMGEETLEHAMRICIEGPERLTDETLEEIIKNYKKSRKEK